MEQKIAPQTSILFLMRLRYYLCSVELATFFWCWPIGSQPNGTWCGPLCVLTIEKNLLCDLRFKMSNLKFTNGRWCYPTNPNMNNHDDFLFMYIPQWFSKLCNLSLKEPSRTFQEFMEFKDRSLKEFSNLLSHACKILWRQTSSLSFLEILTV